MLVALDLETTGVSPSLDRPVQIGLVGEQAGTRRVLMNALINPGKPIPKEATSIHGITDKMVEFAPDAGMAAWSIELLLGSCGVTTLATFNGECYDLLMLDACLGRPMIVPAKHIDVLSVAYRYLPGLPSYKLDALYPAIVGSPRQGAHDARTDANDTLDLLRALRVKIGMTLEQLAEDMETPKPYVLFPFGQYRGKLLQEVGRGWAIWALNSFGKMRPDLELSLRMVVDGTA